MQQVQRYMRYQILQLVWPVVLEGVGIMLVGLVTTAMVGQFGAVSLSAVGLSSMVQAATSIIFAAAGTGAAAIVAREVGAGNWDEVRVITGQGVLLGLAFGTLLAVVGVAISPFIFYFTSADENVATLASSLLQITFVTSPFFLTAAIGNAVMRAMGMTRLTFYITAINNLIAIVLAYMLIFGKGLPGMGAYGAAWAAGITQATGGMFSLAALFILRKVKLRAHHIFTIRGGVIKRIVDISLPAGLEQLAMQGGRIAYTFMLASVGANQFAGHQVALQVESISFMPGFGFSVAAMTLVGQNLGKGVPHRAAQYAWLTNRMAVGSMTVMGVLFFFLAKPLTGLFIQEPEVVYWGMQCVMIAALEQPTIALTYVLGGALRGAGDTRWPMYVTTAGVWFVRIPLIYLFIIVLKYDITAAWYITAADFLVRSIILWRRVASNKWQ